MEGIKKLLSQAFHAGRRFENREYPTYTFEDWFNIHEVEEELSKLRQDAVIKNEVTVCEHHKTCCYPRDSGETCLPQKGCFEQQTVL